MINVELFELGLHEIPAELRKILDDRIVYLSPGGYDATVLERIRKPSAGSSLGRAQALS